ncbi:hypothetical protein CYMTET_5218 [Cymbomonas tetramitiformis]|uniref:Uncharacterized protein n=1 Tax=Cymbomonas tetramitiformis TaxID=36881 RepID=A0AAE0H1H8_9CHLO|nr:hypothetical protein CYMTET_5218 [Cymbomonas tetramitiformis]
MSAPTTRARRRLLLDSGIDASIRLIPAVRDSPTPSTPPVPIPAAAQANDSEGIKQARALFEGNNEKVVAIYAKRRHRQWAKAVRELALGGKEMDGRRSLLDLIKGCVPPGVRQTLQEERSQLRYLARVDPRPILAKEQRLVRDNRAEDWTPTETSRPKVSGAAYFVMDSKIVEVLGQLTTRLENIEAAIKFQRLGCGGRWGGSFRRGAALAEYGAPAVLTGDESDGIDVSAYGFSVPGSSGVLTELEGLTSQVKAMEAKVGVHLSQVSLLGDDDVGAHRAPVSALSAKSAVTSDAPQHQVVPHMGGSSAGGVPAAGSHYGVPMEEFPGGIDLVCAGAALRAFHDS